MILTLEDCIAAFEATAAKGMHVYTPIISWYHMQLAEKIIQKDPKGAKEFSRRVSLCPGDSSAAITIEMEATRLGIKL